MGKPSKIARDLDEANKNLEAPVYGNCDQYIDRITLNKRYKRSEMICKINGKHMNPALKAGCSYHPANRGNRYTWLK